MVGVGAGDAAGLLECVSMGLLEHDGLFERVAIGLFECVAIGLLEHDGLFERVVVGAGGRETLFPQKVLSS